jgi:hypothetical protein
VITGVPSAIAWAGGPDATAAKPAEDAAPEKGALAELLSTWPDGRRFTARALLSLLTPGAEHRAFRSALELFLGEEAAADVTEAGYKLRSVKGAVIDGRRLAADLDKKKKIQEWRVERV